MLIKIYPENPDDKRIRQVVDELKKGGVIIYPTDTVYSIGCSLLNHKAVERVAKIKGIKLDKANFSLVCEDLSHLSEYAKQLDTPIYKMMRKALPGPFTFILNASKNVPKLFQSKKKTVGIRVPNNSIALAIVRELGHPLVSTSVHDDDDVVEYTTDPELIHEKYDGEVNLIIDGGYGDNVASTVIDCTSGEPELIREGAGDFDSIL